MLLQTVHPRPVVLARVASAREVVLGQPLPPLLLADHHKRLAVRVHDLLASRYRLAGKAQSDPAPGDSVVVRVAAMVDQGQGGVGRPSDLLQAVVRPAGACFLDLGGLVRVVEGDPHEVVEEEGSLSLLITKLFLWLEVAGGLQQPEEEPSARSS